MGDVAESRRYTAALDAENLARALRDEAKQALTLAQAIDARARAAELLAAKTRLVHKDAFSEEGSA
jgi:hypothetical protein